MDDAIVVVGFGSIGKRHTKNLLDMGIRPFVLTQYPDEQIEAKFVSKLEDIFEGIKYAVICSATYKHPADILELAKSGVRNFLVEKPIAADMTEAHKILELAEKEKLNISVAYNMRYLPCFGVIKDFIQQNLSAIRMVDICAGQDLRQWRPYKDYRKSYSVDKRQGGGIDLDLSHEIDYMLWLFKEPTGKNIVKAKVSELEMDCPDVFVGTYKYRSFVVTVRLDCIRQKKERYIKIICENGNRLECDFVNNVIKQVLDETEEIIDDKSLFDMNKTYIDEMEEFLGISVETKLLTTLEESVKVLEAIN
ncbi:MAG: Gfo/Idh/MocA family oxidoreductase [Sedimentisphaerales bacterium]|nr:Gfo/Idh/MocA family oxidoreductase [Sedimentisphaerales bacterium]